MDFRSESLMQSDEAVTFALAEQSEIKAPLLPLLLPESIHRLLRGALVLDFPRGPRGPRLRPRADLNRDRWIQGPECWPLHHEAIHVS